MRKYKVLFADDSDDQFDVFKQIAVPALEAHGIRFEPLDYARCLEVRNPATGESVVERLKRAEEEGPYDVVISDLNFAPKGYGGDRDGFHILRLAHKKFPKAKLLLVTAFSRDIDPSTAIGIARDTGIREAQWINLMGGSLDWQNVATVCKVLCDAIDVEKNTEENGKAPALFDINVLEETFGIPGHQDCLRIRLQERNTDKVEQITFVGDHAIVFSTIIDNQRNFVSGKQILKDLNKSRLAAEGYTGLSSQDKDNIFKVLGIKLLSADTNTQRPEMCRQDNENLCNWQRSGEAPSPGSADWSRREGSDCYAKAAFLSCPKKLHKRKIPKLDDTGFKEGAGAERRKVKELRQKYLKPLTGMFGEDIHTENGLIRSHKRLGYAIAANVFYEV